MMIVSFVRKNLPQAMLMAFMLGLFSCSSRDQKNAEDVREAYVIPDSILKTLKIDTVKMGSLTNAIKFNGIVDFNPDKVANVFPMISGNVQDVKADLGSYVTQGQVLGVIKSAEMANYDATLVNAETNMTLNASLLARQKEMAKSGLASQVDVTTADVGYQQAVAAKNAAQKILSINGNNRQGEYLIKAPISGFIVQKNITNGMSIRPDNANNLFTISDLKEVWVMANVYEANIDKVHQGDEVDVTTITYPDKVFKGKIDQLMNTLDPANRVMKMRVILPNPDYKLKPQMFATVTVNQHLDQEAISIPASALVFDHSQYYVVIYKGPRDIQLRSVELLSANNNNAFIKSGLSLGERVIASDALLIYGALN
jgi:cobalt-zinc-cadmium efflux system membrane fusion protein